MGRIFWLINRLLINIHSNQMMPGSAGHHLVRMPHPGQGRVQDTAFITLLYIPEA
jgi:hypothetical protein